VNQRAGAKVDWTRDGNLVRRGKPNPSRPGSSKGKIGRSKVQGAREVLRDMDRLVKRSFSYIRSDIASLKKAFGSIRKETTSL